MTIDKLKYQVPDFKFDQFFIHFPLNITNESSIIAFGNFLIENNLKLDILMKNAGIYNKKDIISIETYEQTFATNFNGTINLTEQFLEKNLLNKDAKIILVTSSLGNINLLKSENLKVEFRTKNYDLSYLYVLSNKFKKSIKNKTVDQEG